MKANLQQLYTYLQGRFRLVLYDERDLAAINHAQFSRLMLFAYLFVLLLGLSILLFGAIVFTPLKHYVPGYGNFDNYRRTLHLQRRTDSLASITQAQYVYMMHLRGIFADTLAMDIPDEALSPLTEWADSGANTAAIPFLDTLSLSEQDLRNELEQQSATLLAVSNEAAIYQSDIAGLYFFAPAEGLIVQNYNPQNGEFGIAIAGKDADPIKAISDGVVLMSSYSTENAYTIVLQHDHNLVSVYKGNASLLKKTGVYVRAGEVIAQMGKGLRSSPKIPCLYFELWHRQQPVNPIDYILF